MAGRIDPSQLSSAHRTADTPPAAVDSQTGTSMPRPGVRLEGGAIGSGPFRPTLSLDPANVKSIPDFQEFERELTPAVNAFSTAYEGLKQIAAARDQLNKDQSKTDEQKLLVVAGRAEKAFNHMLHTFDKARADLTAAEKALDESLSKPLVEQASAGNSIPGEIRSFVRGLSTEERFKFINDAMKNNDTRSLTAVLGAPAYLSGLANETQKVFTRQYHEASNPVVVRRLVATRAAIEMIDQRSGLVFEQVEKALRGTFKQVKELRGQVEASEKALAAIGGGA